MTEAVGSRSARLIGLDLFRALAVFGMLVAHVGPAAWTAGHGLGQEHWVWEVFHSRMPLMFAFAAGFSMNLSRRSGSAGSARAAIVIRAALLILVGFALTALGTPVVVILSYFGVFFLLSIPLQTLSARPLFVIAAVWGVAGPPLSFWLRTVVDLPGNPLWTGLVAGDYPALTWMPFILMGMAVGRLDLASASVRWRIGAAGAVTALIAYGASALALALGARDALIAAVGSTDALTAPQHYARLLHHESGVTDTSSWLWLFTSASHSGSWGDIWGALGVCGVLLALLLPLGDWAGRGSHHRLSASARGLIRLCAAPGAMVLSVYAAHIVAMWAITAATGYSFGPAQPVWILASFTLGAIVFAGLWMRRHSRGPLESLMGGATAAVLRVARKERRGSA
ncbi:MAG: heparan-alpha-glucosaminide N-acetyltransferase domain-containing protein [Rhodoglobus sp.]